MRNGQAVGSNHFQNFALRAQKLCIARIGFALKHEPVGDNVEIRQLYHFQPFKHHMNIKVQTLDVWDQQQQQQEQLQQERDVGDKLSPFIPVVGLEDADGPLH